MAFLREANDSKSVTDIFDSLYKLLGFENFTKIFPICLADNGTEFFDSFGIEADSDGVIKSRLFYCNPSSPGQKGACENNHEFIRRIIPKSTDLGQYTQSQIDIMMDYINSYGRPELGDSSSPKVPFTMAISASIPFLRLVYPVHRYIWENPVASLSITYHPNRSGKQCRRCIFCDLYCDSAHR